MPELPEVETVRRGLSDLIVGRVIVDATSDTPKSFPNSPSDIEAFLLQASVTDVRRRAKVLLIDLSSGYTIVTHLKMTGQLVFVGRQRGVDNKVIDSVSATSSEATLRATSSARGVRLALTGTSPSDIAATESASDAASNVRFGAGHPNDSLVNQLPDKSTRVIITFSDDSHLYFNDQRKFGWMKLIPTLEVPNMAFMQKVGPEPLEADFTPEQFAARFTRRAGTSIKAALLDQTVVAGVGNIYADESLWGAKIHPKRLVKTITPAEFALLYTELRSVMNLAIEKGGSTNQNYVNAEGKRGSYMDFARVFRREGQACPRCGATIIKFKAAGRGTHICPVCQVL